MRLEVEHSELTSNLTPDHSDYHSCMVMYCDVTVSSYYLNIVLILWYSALSLPPSSCPREEFEGLSK